VEDKMESTRKLISPPEQPRTLRHYETLRDAHQRAVAAIDAGIRAVLAANAGTGATVVITRDELRELGSQLFMLGRIAQHYTARRIAELEGAA
jgi:hypothetical protein